MAITWTERIAARFQPVSHAADAYRSRIDCTACGTTNRRRLQRRDDRCWNCDAELPRQDIPVRS